MRTGAPEGDLGSKVLAAVVVGAERAAVRHWMNQRPKAGSLVETVDAALRQALHLQQREP
jgi:hypothetical protein